MAHIPADPVMLLSFINTQLRDNYASFQELCKSLDINADDIIQKLESIDYHYNSDQNKFC